MTDTAPRIISEAEAVALLRRLVEIRSHSHEEAAAAANLVDEMSRLGYEAHVDEVGNAVGVREAPDENGECPFEVVLLGHIDTVPGDVPVRVEDGVLYGRGSVDAKGPLATFVIAGAQAALMPGTRLVVVGAVEEEAATSKGAHHIAATYQPNLCIIGEPSGWDAVTLGYKGRVLWDFHYSQPSAHRAGPERAVAEYAVDWWNAIRAYADAHNDGIEGVFDQLSPSLRRIESRSDGLIDAVCAEVGVRLPPDFDFDAFAAVVEEAAGEATLTRHEAVPAYREPRTSPLVRAFSASLRAEGLRPRLKVKTGTADMNVVAPAWGCPTVAYGPGDSQLDHTPNEHLLLDDYHDAIRVLTRTLETLDGRTL